MLENLGRGCPKDLTGLVAAVQSHPQLAVLIQVNNGLKLGLTMDLKLGNGLKMR